MSNTAGSCLLFAEKIPLDHEVEFVQVDDIHQFDCFRKQHAVHQSPDHRYQAEARGKKRGDI